MEDMIIHKTEPGETSEPLRYDDDAEACSCAIPTQAIDVVARYENWCVLCVARGKGPRAVEEWVAMNYFTCFNKEYPIESGEDDSKMNSIQNAILANPHNSACARSLILVPRTRELLEQLVLLRVTVHCLVKGYLAPGSTIDLSSEMERRSCKTSATCIKVVPSNSAGNISLLEVYNNEPNSTYIAPRQFRRHLQDAGYPVLGGTRDCYAFRGEKCCLSIVGLEFQTQNMPEPESIFIPPVPRLQRVLEKEERFWKEKQRDCGGEERDINNGLATPLAYIEGKATFDGLEFSVSPEVMIPRQGSEALVETVDEFYKKKTSITSSPQVLDLGTGCGNLLLATLKRLARFNAKGVGIDVASDALDIANQNIELLNMQKVAKTQKGSFAELGLLDHEPFDVALCNPPYMTKGGRRNLDASVLAYEPERALFVGRENPNIHYRDALDSLTKGNMLTEGALLVFEVCKENAEPIAELMKTRQFEMVQIGRDSKGCIRTAHGIFNPTNAGGPSKRMKA